MSLLRELGYHRLRDFVGGMETWEAAGLPVESGVPAGPSESRRVIADAPDEPRSARLAVARQWGTRLLDMIEDRSTTGMLRLWLGLVLACAALYWLAGVVDGHGLVEHDRKIGLSLGTLPTAVYFSFVTATSLGYGDVIPLGVVRVIAVAEAVAGLLIFGALVSRFVSRRQDEIVREIHQVTFEDRLDRVQMNLHLVLTELQTIGSMCSGATLSPERVLVRLESATMVFAAELRTIHDLLYHPQRAPDEVVLEGILANLSAALHELVDLLECLSPEIERPPGLMNVLRTMSGLARNICGHCVPREYAPALKDWMNSVQETADRISGLSPG